LPSAVRRLPHSGAARNDEEAPTLPQEGNAGICRRLRTMEQWCCYSMMGVSYLPDSNFVFSTWRLDSVTWSCHSVAGLASSPIGSGSW